MNFQDLFARYREMGAMAPQHSLDEQLLMLSGDPQKMDLPPPENNCEGTKKERIMFKLPSPNTFRPFLMSMDEEHKQGLLGDEEVEDLLQPSPPLQQGWNLGLLKTNSLCKDYYKLTSNMLHTLIMGIKELTDGEISPAWQVAQDRAYQKQSSFSNTFLQDVANKSMAPTDLNSAAPVHDASVATKPNTEPSIYLEHTCGPPLKPALNKNGGQMPAPKEMVEREKDIDGILELRKLLWRQIVPYTCLGATLDPRQDGEKKIRLVQESRMKVVNNVGFGVNSESNCTFRETSQVSLTVGRQQVAFKESDVEVVLSPGTPSMDTEQNGVTPAKTSRMGDNMETESVDEDAVDEEVHGRSTSRKEDGDHGATKTEYSVSFPEEDTDMQLEEEFSREVNDTQPLKRSKFSVNEETRSEQPKSSRSKYRAKETRFSIDGQILPIYDEEFEIVEEEKENPSRYPDRNLLGYTGGEDGSNQKYIGNRNNRHFKQRSMAQYKEAVAPAKPTARSWCIVGSFNSKSPTTSRSNLSHSQKTTKRI